MSGPRVVRQLGSLLGERVKVLHPASGSQRVPDGRESAQDRERLVVLQHNRLVCVVRCGYVSIDPTVSAARNKVTRCEQQGQTPLGKC